MEKGEEMLNINRNTGRRKIKKITAVILMATALSTLAVPMSGFGVRNVITAYAAQTPEVAAQGAILVNETTGEVLYEKNADTRFYPASITKIMTALLVAERGNLDDTVTYSAAATTNLESGAVTLGVTAGDKISVRDSLYGLLLYSANEIANGLAEYVSGSVPAFADLMNQKAAELGCTNTHFVNPNGLNNANHYTTPRDMAKIANAAYNNEIIRSIDTTVQYTFPATKKRPSAKVITMGHKMINPADPRYYPGIIGGKTGYTSKAGNTLVTAVEKDGVRMIAVVMKASQTQYQDTKALLDYGFATVEENRQTPAPAPQENVSVNTSNNTSTTGNSVKAGVVGPGANMTKKGQQKNAGPGENLPSESRKPEQPENQQRSPQTVAESESAGWHQNGQNWYYIKQSGQRAVGEMLNIKGANYYFDGNGIMATGWLQDPNGDWYYLRDSGDMIISGWLSYKNQWYYLGQDGKMLKDTVTPDGYRVNHEGVWS